MARDPASSDLESDHLRLLDRYAIERPLASGGMGSVWLGRDLRLGGPVAVKFLSREGATAEGRFLNEARIASGLTSPHIVRVFDTGVHESTPFLVMEYLEGETLRSHLLSFGSLGADRTLSIIAQIASGVHVAHEAGVVHRDLKPANIFLAEADADPVVKILDFGVAKFGEDPVTEDGAVVGTAHYLSPEAVNGSPQIDRRSDLWAIGVIAHECLTGVRPFSTTNVRHLLHKIAEEDPPLPSTRADVPPTFDDWFRKACARDPSQRFQDARELSRALEIALTGTTRNTGKKPRSAPDRDDQDPLSTTVFSPTEERRRSLGIFVATGVVAMLGLGWFAKASLSLKSSSPAPENDSEPPALRDGTPSEISSSTRFNDAPKESATSEPPRAHAPFKKTIPPKGQSVPSSPAPEGTSPEGNKTAPNVATSSTANQVSKPERNQAAPSQGKPAATGSGTGGSPGEDEDLWSRRK